MDASNAAVVGVRLAPHVIAGRLPPADEQAVSAWIALNEAPVIDHWDGRIDTVQSGRLSRSLP